jgi:hypothetical protein
MNPEIVERAYTVAAYWHRGQKRRNGDPYITHSVEVAEIVAGQGADPEVVCAALLHDLLEDTGCTEEELVLEFGERITGLVTAMMAVDSEEALAACTDERVLLLKLSDRLHNLRTIRALAPARQREKSRQTLGVLVPRARRLGLDEIADELNELSVRTLSGEGEGGIGTAFQALSLGSVLLPREERVRWLEEWLNALQALPGRGARLRFTLGLLRGLPRMTADYWAPHTRRGVAWLIRSDARVFALLTPLLIWMTIGAGPREAVAIVITVPPVLYAGVSALRRRL